jgi:hypothetical protein
LGAVTGAAGWDIVVIQRAKIGSVKKNVGEDVIS